MRLHIAAAALLLLAGCGGGGGGGAEAPGTGQGQPSAGNPQSTAAKNPASEPTKEPVAVKTSPPAQEPAKTAKQPEPDTEPVKEPAPEPVKQPEPEPEPEPVVNPLPPPPAQEPAKTAKQPEPDTEPVKEPAPEPVKQPEPEPEPVKEPEPEPEPEPVKDPPPQEEPPQPEPPVAKVPASEPKEEPQPEPPQTEPVVKVPPPPPPPPPPAKKAPQPVLEYARSFPEKYLNFPDFNVDQTGLNSESYLKERPSYIHITKANFVHWSFASTDSGSEQVSDRTYFRGQGVTVAVVDSGVDINHPDLKANIVEGVSAAKVRDDVGHGTAVAGIIAARLDGVTRDVLSDGQCRVESRAYRRAPLRLDDPCHPPEKHKGVVGVAPEAKILPVKFIGRFGNTRSASDAYLDVLASDAFVVNNSYGRGAQLIQISVKENTFRGIYSPIPPGRYWIEIPRRYTARVELSLKSEKLLSFDQISAEDYDFADNLIKAAKTGNKLIVFAAGNEGWNSAVRAGGIKFCKTALAFYRNGELGYCPQVANMFASSNFVSITVVGAVERRLISPDLEITPRESVFEGDKHTIVAFGKNEVGIYARIPVDTPETAENWLNVVSGHLNPAGCDGGGNCSPSKDFMHHFSNGCGVTKWRCLTALGFRLRTLERWANYDEYYAYGDGRTGTSYAAPLVSGAAALLKGAFPNLSPKDVGHILLESADGAGTCRGVDKKISCADDAYGHGFLNVSAAFTPTSFIQLAANDEEAQSEAFALEKSRIALSPAFAAAPWREESLRVGGLDNYGRVFYTQMDLSNGAFVIKPAVSDGSIDGGAIHRAYAPPLSQVQTGEVYSAGEQLASAEWSQPAAEGGLGYGIKHGSRIQSRHIGVSHGDGRLSWRYRSGGDWYSSAASRQTYWHAPFDNGEVHQFSWQHRLTFAGDIGAPQAGVLYSSGDGVHQMAGRLQWQRSNWQLQAEGGLLRENDQFLGASLEGAFAVEQSDTTYHRLSSEYELDKLRLYAEYVRSSSKAAGAGGIVKALHARADAWGAGVEYGRWNVSVSQPLAITRGRMGLSYISGYTAGGDYAVEERALDLSSGSRMQRLSVQYVREAINGLEFVLSADYLRNAPHRAYSGDAAVFSGALRYTF